MKTIILALFFVAVKAHALCVPTELTKKLGCEVSNTPASCLEDYGTGYVPVVENNSCDAKKVIASLKQTVPSGVLAKVKSSSDEIDKIVTMIDRKGIKNDLLNLKMVEVKSFNEDHIKSLLEKMKVLRNDLYLLTISVDSVNSKLGKQAIIYAARYYSFMGRIHQIMANAAHQDDNQGHNLSFAKLSLFTLKVDKRVGLEILARMNLKARHLDSETLKIIVSEEEKQNFEFNILQAPHTLNGYAKLVQFMSIREFLSNRWALQRISNQTLENPKVSYCGPKMLSFGPGPDQTMGSSDISNELHAFDLYFTQVPKIVDSLVSASKKASVMSPEKSSAMLEKVFKGLPTFRTRMIEEWGWTESELTGWQNDIAATLKQNEDNEWAQYAQSTLSVSIFPGDKLTPSFMEDRLISDIFNLRKEALQTQMDAMMNDLTADEKSKMHKIVSSSVEERRATWEAAMRPLIRPLLAGINDLRTFRSQNYLEKVAQTKEIVSNTLSAAYFQNHIVTKTLKKKMSGKPKVNILDLEPKSPSELVEYFQAKLVKHSGLNYYMDKDADKRKIITDFFQVIAKRYESLSTSSSVRTLQVKLVEIVHDEAQKVFAKYPLPKAEVKPVDPYRISHYDRPIIVADNTRVARPYVNPYVKVTIGEETPAPSVDKTPVKPAPATPVPPVTQAHTSDSLRTSYNVVSMARLQPVVADNTRVVINRRLPEFKAKNLPKAKTYVVHIDELNFLLKNENFVTTFFDLIGVERGQPTKAILKLMTDQNIMADIRLAAAYNASALLKIPLIRIVSETEFVPSMDGITVQREVKEEKPALIRMLPSFTLNANGTHSINDVTLVGTIKETISVALDNQKGKVSKVCLADYRKPGTDKNFKDLFRSSTFIRQGILSDEALAEEVAARLQKLDDKLKTETRYWHEAISEDWIEPMMNVAMVVFIVSALIIPILGSGGLLTPGSVMLLMTILDGVDLAITGASLYFRSVSTFYEVPAQVKFQKSLAYTQVENFSLTTWDDVSAAEKSSQMAKTLLIAFSPLDAIVGGQLYFSAKRLMGVSGKQALKRAGMPVRGFGAPPKTLAPKLSMKEMIKQKGVVKGTVAKVGQELTDLKYWTPRYQPIDQSELTGSLRKAIVGKSKRITANGLRMIDAGQGAQALADVPWKMMDDLKAATGRIDDRLNVNKIVDEITGKELHQASMAGRMTFKEFLAKPSYAMEWMVPKTMIKAIKEGRLVNYLSNWGDTIESMSRLRGRLLAKRKKLMATMMDKLDEVHKLSITDPGYLAANGKSNWMDHFQSLMTDEELKAFRDIAKTGKGTLSEMKSAFNDYDTILETIVPFSSVHGRSLARLGKAYGEGMETLVKDEKNDLFDMYLDILENDGSVHIRDTDVLDIRRTLEDKLD